MKIKHRMQPPASRVCGQTFIAMLLDVNVDKAARIIGRRGGTTTMMLSAFLRSYGFECGDYLTRTTKNWEKPDLCIIKLTFDGQRSGHWILWNGETKQYHDPALTEPVDEDIYEAWLPTTLKNARITSYLALKKVE